MSEFHENQANSRALGILVEAFSLVLEDSKANAGRVAVNELSIIPKEPNVQIPLGLCSSVSNENQRSLSFLSISLYFSECHQVLVE
jgi:hypothetical protein